MSTDDVELFGSTVASVGAGYRNLRLLARSTASVDVNIPSTSEKKKQPPPAAAAALTSSAAAARLTVAHNKHAGEKKNPDWLVLRGQPSSGAFSRLSLPPLSGATRRTDGSAERGEEFRVRERSHWCAWEQL